MTSYARTLGLFSSTMLTLVVLRRRDATSGATNSGFTAPRYPASVAPFVLAALYVVFGSIASNPLNAMRRVVLLIAGVPVFLYWQRGGVSSRET